VGSIEVRRGSPWGQRRPARILAIASTAISRDVASGLASY